jgi:hypothetical protein
MSIGLTSTLPSLSRRRLALGLAAALGCSLSTAWADALGPSDPAVMMDRLPYVHVRSGSAAPASGKTPAHPTGMTYFVDTCADDGSPNSLRSLVEGPTVHSGDTIDLAHLPMMCSKITLSNSFVDEALTVTQDTLSLHGPGADQLTIDANGYSSVFRHYGNGVLEIEGLTVANGYHKTAGPPQVLPWGGCIFSTGSVVLTSSVVSHCEAVSTSNNDGAVGGGVSAQGDLRMYFSSIIGSSATGISSTAYGGGAWTLGQFTASYSTISGNSATGSAFGQGGGLEAYASVSVIGSTISGNGADYDGGLFVGGSSATGVVITNSSITDNVARSFAGILTAQPIALSNSTVAFNKSTTANHEGAGVYLIGADASIKSSIVAVNFNAAGPADIGAQGGQLTALSRDNLIIASTEFVPSGTINDCPKLEPLADNGGPTLTHALNHASPAIDEGDNDAILDSDQRQVARVIGARADIGAVEWSPTDHDERIFLGGFDAKCEW